MLSRLLKLIGLEKNPFDLEEDQKEDIEQPINQDEVQGYYDRDSQMFDERREELEKEEARRKAIEKFKRGEVD